jgi:Starch-binding associating with outer membrane
MTKTKIILSALVVALALSSCSKLIKDNQNNDPTVLTVADPTVLLPTAEAALMYYHGGDAARFASLYTQQIVGGANQYASFATYQFSDADFQNQWKSYYSTVLNNLNKVNIYSKTNGYKFYEGITEVLSAYTFAELVDLYGDIPYSEALKGSTNLTPKFDKGADIYASLLTRIDDAVVLLSGDAAKAGLAPGVDDLIYGGDIAKWIMFANALKARMYLHLSKIDASAIAKGIAAANQGFITASDEAVVAIPAPSTSPAFQFQSARNGDILYIGSELFNQMNTDGDGRMNKLLDTVADAMGPFYGSANSAVPLLSYTEQLFILAELEARSGAASAGATFANAIKASFNQVGAVGALPIIAAYPYNAAETNVALRVKPIMQQKYVAMFNTVEVLNDWRRTGIPSLTPAVGTKIPRRFLYPIIEKNSNPNVPTGVTVYDPVFWDN